MARYAYEGIEWYAPARPPDASWVPLYRLHCAGDREDHLYTASVEERVAATAQGYVFEGIACHVRREPGEGLAPLHRFYCHPERDHFYTVRYAEGAHAPGYAYEGVAGWVAVAERPGFGAIHRGYQPTTRNHLYTGSEQEIWAPALAHQAPPPDASEAGLDTFCISPWKHLEVRREGHVDFCCKYRFPLTAACGTPLSVQRQSLDEIWNSDDIRHVRKAMVEGRRLPGCALCYEREANGFPSDRTRVNREWESGWLNPERATIDEWKRRAIADDFRDEAPAYVELRTGNLCNLKCRICFGDTSSRIAADPVHGRWAPGRTYEGVERWWQDAAVLDEVFSRPGRLRQLYLLGGEPFLIEETGDILRAVIERGVAGDVELEIVTNGTVAQVPWLPLIERFRRLRLHVSLDGVGELNRYLRYPARWETIVESIASFRALPRTELAAAVVLQAYNALDIVELFRFCDAAGLRIGYVFPIDHPRWLRTDVVPPAGRRRAARRLRDYAASDCRLENRALMGSLADGLDSFGDALDEPALHEFLRFTAALDASRDRSLAEVCPELWALVHGMPLAGGPP